MATPVSDFLLSLARDPSLVDNFHESVSKAREAMSAAHLSDDQQNTLLSGDQNAISSLVQAEYPQIAGGMTICMGIMVNRPGGGP